MPTSFSTTIAGSLKVARPHLESIDMQIQD